MKKLILFTATWCPNCTTLKSNLEQGSIDYTAVDVDSEEGATLAQNKGVRGLPTVIIEDINGEEIRRIVGIQPVSEYRKFV